MYSFLFITNGWDISEVFRALADAYMKWSASLRNRIYEKRQCPHSPATAVLTLQRCWSPLAIMEMWNLDTLTLLLVSGKVQVKSCVWQHLKVCHKLAVLFVYWLPKSLGNYYLWSSRKMQSAMTLCSDAPLCLLYESIVMCGHLWDLWSFEIFLFLRINQ